MIATPRDEHQDFKEEMHRLRALRGKNKARWVAGFEPCFLALASVGE